MDIKENVTLFLNLPMGYLIIHYNENPENVSRAALVI